MPCKRCNGTDFQRDGATGNSFCCGCGTLQEYDNYEAQLGGISGPQGTYIRVGTTGTGSTLAYKDKKIFEAGNLIDDITERLQLGDKSEEVKRMIGKITDGEFGKGEWFSVLIGACCYALVRKEGSGVLTMDEIVNVVGCDLHQLGSMCKRVVEYLGIELGEFDLVGLFVKTASSSPRLSGVDGKKKERVVKQGGFLMNCSLKWFLSTGRRPMPLVVAVLAFVCQVNGVKCRIDDLARDCEVSLCTCKLRYKELLERLVKVAKEIGLPWAGDVNVKNVVKHSGALIGLMEAKSMRKRRGDELVISSDGVCLKEIVRDCLRKEAMYCYDDDDDDEGEKSSFLQMVSCEDWWKGKSKMSQRLKLKEVLERDVGLDDLPVSFIKGCDAVERRREKIKAAKLRIGAVQDPCDDDDKVSGRELSLEIGDGKKKRKRGYEIDWEDLVIQTLVLHNVKDEEIEKGHYNALLGLHVFN